jgi:hypothetical protein
VSGDLSWRWLARHRVLAASLPLLPVVDYCTEHSGVNILDCDISSPMDAGLMGLWWKTGHCCWKGLRWNTGNFCWMGCGKSKIVIKLDDLETTTKCGESQAYLLRAVQSARKAHWLRRRQHSRRNSQNNHG